MSLLFPNTSWPIKARNSLSNWILWSQWWLFATNQEWLRSICYHLLFRMLWTAFKCWHTASWVLEHTQSLIYDASQYAKQVGRSVWRNSVLAPSSNSTKWFQAAVNYPIFLCWLKSTHDAYSITKCLLAVNHLYRSVELSLLLWSLRQSWIYSSVVMGVWSEGMEAKEWEQKEGRLMRLH